MSAVIQVQPSPRAAALRPSNSSFSANDWAVLSRHWYPVAMARDVADSPMPVVLLDTPLVVYRTGQGVRVKLDRCVHRGVPLSMGWVEGDELVCRYHGLRFGPDGQCTRIPAQPELKPSPRFCLTSFPAVERYGLIWTCLDDDGTGDIPPFEAWDDPNYQAILPPSVDIDGSAGRQVEGFVDVAHFAWVHHEAFADRDLPEVPAYQTQVSDQCIRSEYWSTVSNFPKGLQHLAPAGFSWLRVYEIFPPFTARLTISFPEEARLHILNAASPISATRTRLFVPIARNFDKTGSLEDVYAFNAQVFQEDKEIVERQWPKELPLQPDAEAHFAADRTSTAYRRALVKMGLGS